MALISQSELEAKLGRTLTASEASTFAIINAANQSYIEKLIGSSVEAANASSRYYDGGVQHLAIDPCTDVTAVKLVDEDNNIDLTLDTSDYSTEPVNTTLKTMIRYRFGKLVSGINNIQITAKFSIYADTQTLNIVKNALLDALVSQIDSGEGILKESIEGYSVEYASAQTKSSLDSIKYLFPRI
jgi:hypothetical protein